MACSNKCPLVGPAPMPWTSNRDMASPLSSNSSSSYKNSYNRFKWESKTEAKSSLGTSWCKECQRTVSWLTSQEPILPPIHAGLLKSLGNQQGHLIITKRRAKALWMVINNFFSHHKTQMRSSKCKCRIITVKMEVVSISIIHSKHNIHTHQLQDHRLVATRPGSDKWSWLITTTSIKLNRIILPTVWVTLAWTRDQHHLIALQVFIQANLEIVFKAPATPPTIPQEDSPRYHKQCCTKVLSWLTWTRTTVLRVVITQHSRRPTENRAASTNQPRSWFSRTVSTKEALSNTSKILMDKPVKEQTYW
jgi:hypothetical protein